MKAITLPANIPKPPRLGEKRLPQCRSNGKDLSKDLSKDPSGIELYQPPLTKKNSSSSSKTESMGAFGSPSPTQVESKMILLMGATGSGKTTLIHAMLNYILGVEWEDSFRALFTGHRRHSRLR